MTRVVGLESYVRGVPRNVVRGIQDVYPGIGGRPGKWDTEAEKKECTRSRIFVVQMGPTKVPFIQTTGNLLVRNLRQDFYYCRSS